MRLKLTPRRLTAREVLRERLFVTQSGLPQAWQRHYWGRVPTRLVPHGRSHQLRLAF